jgi:hypothetical protein
LIIILIIICWPRWYHASEGLSPEASWYHAARLTVHAEYAEAGIAGSCCFACCPLQLPLLQSEQQRHQHQHQQEQLQRQLAAAPAMQALLATHTGTQGKASSHQVRGMHCVLCDVVT